MATDGWSGEVHIDPSVYEDYEKEVSEELWDKLYKTSIDVAYAEVGPYIPSDHPARNTILHEIADSFRSNFMRVLGIF